MLLRTLFALVALVPAAAQARDWYAVTLNGNACEDMRGYAEEATSLGGYPANSPQQLIDWLRATGASSTPTVDRKPNGDLMVTVTWVAPSGQTLGRIFFSSQSDCALTVAKAINEGVVPAPGELR